MVQGQPSALVRGTRLVCAGVTAGGLRIPHRVGIWRLSVRVRVRGCGAGRIREGEYMPLPTMCR
jgi:hypothetical protein